MNWPLFAIVFVFWTFVFTFGIPWLVQRHRQIKHDKPRLDYDHIARMEIEIYGHTMLNDASPYKEGLTDLYGIADRYQQNIETSKTYVTQQEQWNPGPDWIDEDGKPW